MKAFNKSEKSRLNLQKITIARLNTVESEMIKGGLTFTIDDGDISVTTLNGGGTFQSGYMGSNCNDLVTKTKVIIKIPPQAPTNP